MKLCGPISFSTVLMIITLTARTTPDIVGSRYSLMPLVSPAARDFGVRGVNIRGVNIAGGMMPNKVHRGRLAWKCVVHYIYIATYNLRWLTFTRSLVDKF
ncbi:hypothetical protein K440DRAFT_9139 [Wilcoxina mikolae CBS 423.85]|nr:hypothetical protein K440DRAFT_9139 [Wilcoxina mikolae CBS 423.85]